MIKSLIEWENSLASITSDSLKNAVAANNLVVLLTSSYKCIVKRIPHLFLTFKPNRNVNLREQSFQNLQPLAVPIPSERWRKEKHCSSNIFVTQFFYINNFACNNGNILGILLHLSQFRLNLHTDSWFMVSPFLSFFSLFF